jgi:hypothetical protein
MSVTMGEVKAVVTLDNSQYVAGMKQTGDVAVQTGAKVESATTRAIETSSRKGKEAAELAKQYSKEAADVQTQQLVRLQEQERMIAADRAKLTLASRRGYLEEAQGVQAVAAATQRLAQVRKEIAAISIQTQVPQGLTVQANTRIASGAASATPDAARVEVAQAAIAEAAAKEELKAVTRAVADSDLDAETKARALAAADGVVERATQRRIDAEAVLKERIAESTAAQEQQRRASEANARVSSGATAATPDAARVNLASATIAEAAAKEELKAVTKDLANSDLDAGTKARALAVADEAVERATQRRIEAETILKERIAETTDATERQQKAAEANAALQSKMQGPQASPAAQRIAAASLEQAAAQKALRDVQEQVAASTLGEEEKVAALAPVLARARMATLELAEANEALSESSHQVVSGQQAASASIRALEGNAGLRAVENFISKTLGLGPILQAIFPIVGALAFGQIILESGEKLVALEQKAVHAGDAIKEAYADLHDKAQITNDDLAIQNDKLQDEIDKLSGHPNNGIQTALDEARKMADQLLSSLQADRKELAALLKEHDVSALGSILSGVANQAVTATTGKQKDELLKDQKDLTDAVRKANSEYEAAVAGTTDEAVIKAATEKKNQSVKAAFQSQIEAYNREADRLQKEQNESQGRAALANGLGKDGGGLGTPLHNSDKIANVKGRAQQLQDALTHETYIESIASREQVVGALKQGHESAPATNKAAEERLKAMEEGLNEMKLQYGASIKAEFDYWQERRDEFARGSEQYNAIVAKQATLAVEAQRQAHAALKKIREEDAKDPAARQKVDEDGAKAVHGMAVDNARSAEDRADTANELAAMQAKTQAQLAEMAVRDEAGKTLTQEAAAMETAAIHTKAYGDELERLTEKRKAIETNPLLSNGSADQQRKIDELTKQIAQIENNRQVQIAQDAYGVKNADQSAVEGATDALQEFRMAALDSAAQMRNLVASTMNGLHKQILDAITGKRTDFRGLGESTATGVADMSLKKLETTGLDAAKPLLDKIGLGGIFGDKKMDGQTAGTALHVQIAGQGPGATAGFGSLLPALNGLGGGAGGDQPAADAMGNTFSSMLNLGGDGAAAAGAGSGVGSLVTDAISALGFFADGGPIPANKLSVVGEKGPELFIPGTSGFIVPNHQLTAEEPSLTGKTGAMGQRVAAMVQMRQAQSMPRQKALPKFELGGAIGANTMALVGERGPEVFTPGTSGRITPNSDLNGLGGDKHEWHIDARGATDPAQVHAQIMQAAPHIAAAAVKAMSENKMRTPSSRR